MPDKSYIDRIARDGNHVNLTFEGFKTRNGQAEARDDQGYTWVETTFYVPTPEYPLICTLCGHKSCDGDEKAWWSMAAGILACASHITLDTNEPALLAYLTDQDGASDAASAF